MEKQNWNVNRELIESYELYCPFLYKDTVDIREIDGWTIMATLEDGTRYLYYSDTNIFSRLPNDPEDMTEDECRKEFSRRISRIMLYKGITQKILSERTGIPQSRISDYITGKRSPSFYNVDKIAKALGCSMDRLRYYD